MYFLHTLPFRSVWRNDEHMDGRHDVGCPLQCQRYTIGCWNETCLDKRCGELLILSKDDSSNHYAVVQSETRHATHPLFLAQDTDLQEEDCTNAKLRRDVDDGLAIS